MAILRDLGIMQMADKYCTQKHDAPAMTLNVNPSVVEALVATVRNDISMGQMQ